MDAAARRMLGLVEAALAVTVWGASFVATKIAVAEISPPALVWIRFTMGLVFLAVTTAIRGELAWPRRREVGYFALLGFIGIALHQWLQSDSLLTSNAATVSWLAASSPVFMMLLARIFLGEQLGATGVVAAAIALGGVALVVTAGDLGRLRIPAGDVQALIAAPNWAVFSVLSRWGLRRHPPARMMLYVMATASQMPHVSCQRVSPPLGVRLPPPASLTSSDLARHLPRGKSAALSRHPSSFGRARPDSQSRCFGN